LLIAAYKNLWTHKHYTQTHSNFLALLLLLVSIAIPLTFGLFSYFPDISLNVIKAVIIVACITLFFDIRKYSIFVLPLILFARYHHPIILMVTLLFFSFLAWKIARGELSIDVPYPILLFIILLTGINGLMKSVDLAAGRFYFQLR